MAASFCFGVARSHGYNDGNKRVALAAIYTFLLVNGWEIVATQVEVVEMILQVASSSLDEKGIVTWLESHTEAFQEEE